VAHNFGIMTVVSAYVRLFIGGKVWGKSGWNCPAKGNFIPCSLYICWLMR